ncbi:putative 2-aminoethylphosphonate ABC transporter substrate-binding protein [Bacillus sp. FSL K6-3431]|uniref:putative 2-aminoethylphosphonate ABC transporter substrate-binding protein n=1 Tax=Bacillus sp. FSL K6-3431 TaxID=2921500 RepID=UPI0030F7EFA4
MKNHMLKIVVLVLTFTMLVACGSNVSNGSGKGETDGMDKTLEGELTVYTAIEEELIPEYLETFNDMYPNIKLNIVRDSTGVITAKLLAEGKNTQADVVWGISASSLLALDGKEMLKGYTPKGSDKILPQYKDSEQPEKWIGNTAYMTGVVVNKIELEKLNLPIPKTYEDLLKPEYKGLIVMPHPASSGTGYLTVNGWIQIKGEEKAWNYMRDLHANIGTYTHSGSKPAKLSGSGEYPIGIALVYSGVTQMQSGAPVEVILPEEGLGWDVEANGLINKEDAKNEQLAHAFLDWAITDEVMKKYYQANGLSTMENEFEKPEGFPESVQDKMYKDNNLKWAAENRDQILEKWDTEFAGKAEPKE